MGCIKLTRAKRKLCLGDLDNLIEVQEKTIAPGVIGSCDFTQTFVTILTAWASIQTQTGVDSFDGVGKQTIDTHRFILKYEPSVNITSENVVFFDSEFYRISRVENVDEADSITRIYATKTIDKV